MVQHFVSQNCTQISSTCLVENTIYGYYPSLGFNAFFVAFFALGVGAHAFLGWKTKMYFFGLVLHAGCLAEGIGYAGRIIMHSNPYNDLGFKMQIACLIFAPAWIAAGVYLNLQSLILTFGETTSLLPAKYYTPIFMLCDFISLLLQAIGGGFAGGAAQNVALRNIGTNLMIAGVIFQVVTLIAFAGLVLHYFFRTRSEWNSVAQEAKGLISQTNFRLFLAALTIAFLAIFTRCIYRIAEMVGGWANPIMRDEAGFIALEGFMIVIAVLALTIFHPGFFFPSRLQAGKKGTIESRSEGNSNYELSTSGKTPESVGLMHTAV